MLFAPCSLVIAPCSPIFALSSILPALFCTGAKSGEAGSDQLEGNISQATKRWIVHPKEADLQLLALALQLANYGLTIRVVSKSLVLLRVMSLPSPVEPDKRS